MTAPFSNYTATGLRGLRGLGAQSNPMMSAAAVAAMSAQAASQAAAANSRTVAFAPAATPPATCISKQNWIAAQVACNAGNAASCALVFKPGCPGANPSCATLPTNPVPLCPEPSPCPQGQTSVCQAPPRQNNSGGWGKATVCYCASSVGPAIAVQSATSRWGLYLGIGIAALIVYKVATG